MKEIDPDCNDTSSEDEFDTTQAESALGGHSSSAVVRRRPCTFCGRVQVRLLRCARCKSVRYCDNQCQSDDYPLHKERCVKLDKAAKKLIFLREKKASAISLLANSYNEAVVGLPPGANESSGPVPIRSALALSWRGASSSSRLQIVEQTRSLALARAASDPVVREMIARLSRLPRNYHKATSSLFDLFFSEWKDQSFLSNLDDDFFVETLDAWSSKVFNDQKKKIHQLWSIRISRLIAESPPIKSQTTLRPVFKTETSLLLELGSYMSVQCLSQAFLYAQSEFMNREQ